MIILTHTNRLASQHNFIRRNESKNRAKQSVENISKGLPPDFGIPDPIYGVPNYSSYLFMDSYKKLYNKKNK